MRTPNQAHEPDLDTDGRAITDLDAELDPWSADFVVFSLGSDFADPGFDPR